MRQPLLQLCFMFLHFFVVCILLYLIFYFFFFIFLQLFLFNKLCWYAFMRIMCFYITILHCWSILYAFRCVRRALQIAIWCAAAVKARQIFLNAGTYVCRCISLFAYMYIDNVIILLVAPTCFAWAHALIIIVCATNCQLTANAWQVSLCAATCCCGAALATAGGR